MITQAELRRVMSYDSDSGLFTWNERRSSRVAAGDVAGTVNRKGYVVIEIDANPYLAHRLAWLWLHGSFPQSAIDHIDRNKQNNRPENLRLATDSQNKQNRFEPQKNNAAGLLGVYLHKASGKWVSQIKVNGKRIYLGLFADPESAHSAYMDAKRHVHSFAAA